MQVQANSGQRDSNAEMKLKCAPQMPVVLRLASTVFKSVYLDYCGSKFLLKIYLLHPPCTPLGAELGAEGSVGNKTGTNVSSGDRSLVIKAGVILTDCK